MKLSDQAAACIMGALQKGILEQTDISEILKNFEFDKSPEAKRWGGKAELVVRNPPKFNMAISDSEVR
jgi:hypothetical protein